MTSGPEWEKVERPLLEHLKALGWKTLVWSERQPSHNVERSSDRDVLLEQRLSDALSRINLDPTGEPWLDDARIKSAVAELKTQPAGTRLLEANQESTRLLLNGTTVAGLDGWHNGRDQTVDYIDWRNWDTNDFLAVSQFAVATPGQAPNIRPDVTLFVNGIPLVVIEAKPPGNDNGITDAIDQLRRYANQRGSASAEGAEQLFWTNQLTVATTGERAEAATFSALPEHYMAWKDPHPATVEEIAATLGKSTDRVTQQEILTAGMLTPKHLLDIVRHFTLFTESGSGRTVKIVGRYQQYRGVQKAIKRLLSGDTLAEDGHVDRRGGIIWHTQGSGKSLTMVFLIRAMRNHPELRKFKILLITDRLELQRQLQETAGLSDETVKVARNSAEMRKLLSQPGPGVVMATIQKYNVEAIPETLNESESILVIVDEAHRSHSATLHASLRNAVPNAARIGFTGTPIIMGARKKTLDIFGGYLDQYTLRESEADGSTVPIFYEGRTSDAAVKGASKMDDLFFRWFSELNDEQRETLQHKYATSAQVLEAPELIEAKAKDILRHYISTVMPDGFKGMVVATSRKACVRYQHALTKARDELVAELEQYQSDALTRPEDAVDSAQSLDSDESFMNAAVGQIEMIRELDFAAVISYADHNDPPHYAQWTDNQNHQASVNDFKLPLGPSTKGSSSLALLIVNSMLLTGFDAPQAQVIYLDRMIQEAELLQAVARVNRTAPKKSDGLVVDYYGLSSQLTQALAAYMSAAGEIDPDADAALRPLTHEIDKLEPQRQRVRQIFVQRGVEPTENDVDACVHLLADEKLRTDFDVALRTFMGTLNTVLPRPAALPFIGDLKLFGEIQVQTRRHYRDTPDGDFDPRKYQEKIRRLIDEHITVLDLSRKIPPVRINDAAFAAQVNAINSDRTKASEMEHALRHHIREHIDEDPSYYSKLSKRTDEILSRLEERWDQIALEFEDLISDIKRGPTDEDQTGLDPTTELPFYNQMVDKVASSAPDTNDKLIALSQSLVAEIRRIISTVGFWDNATKQDELRKAIKLSLDDSDLFTLKSLDELSVELRDLTKANQQRLK